MSKCLVEIVECVPNYSICSSLEIMDEIVRPFSLSEKITLMGVESDKFYNRTVVSLLGDPNSIVLALVESYKILSKYVDLRGHVGEHPFIGAIDVIPFIPIQNSSIENCTTYSIKLAKLLWEELKVPSYLYSLSASSSNRYRLPDIRSGGFAKIKDKIKKDEWKLDFGDRVHERLGVSVIGCRPLLVAYNIDIATNDKSITDKISQSIRESSGGFKAVQAQSAKFDDHYQVTINIIDYNITSLPKVYKKVESLSKELGCQILSSEIIGLVKKECFSELVDDLYNLSDNDLIKHLETKIKLRNFDATKFLDYYYKFDKI